jgi:hypothetical protein
MAVEVPVAVAGRDGLRKGRGGVRRSVEFQAALSIQRHRQPLLARLHFPRLDLPSSSSSSNSSSSSSSNSSSSNSSSSSNHLTILT